MPQPALPPGKIRAVIADLEAKLSHRIIAQKHDVSTGTVSNVKALWKQGAFTETLEAPVPLPDVRPFVPCRSKRYAIFPDMHYPEYHRPSWRAAMQMLARIPFDGVVFPGDQLDLGEMSHWNKEAPGKIGKGALKANLDGFGLLLDELDELLQPGSLKRWHRGNHERFIQDFYDQNPQLEGMLDVEDYLKLESRGYECFKLGAISQLGRLAVIHGDQMGSGHYVARKLVDSYCTNIVMGHVHTASSFTKVSASRETRKWMGWTLPTMGTINPAFARDRPNGHVNGFGIVEVYGDGIFNLYTVITDSVTGAFAYGGEVYGL